MAQNWAAAPVHGIGRTSGRESTLIRIPNFEPATRGAVAEARPRKAGVRPLVAAIVWGMTSVLAGGAVMGGFAAAPAQAQAATPNRNAPGSFADLAEKLLPAVVNISTSQNAPQRPQGQRPEIPQFPPGSPFEDFFKDFFDRQQQQDQPQRKATSLGSGFIIDAKNGYVVTNNHVVQDADEITVILQDDTNIKAELVGKDSKTDLALLKIKTSHPLVAVPFGDSDAMRVGDWVLAIGNPFGLGGSVTAGIISARQRNIDAGPYDDFLQTDASINRGNSGGPMFNLNGEVIGINTAIFSPSGGSVGIGFAIPSNLAKQVVAQLKDYGKTRRGWLGVRIQAVTPEIAESLGLPGGHKGALVASVTPDGPAAKGGIQAGDVVTKFDGKEIDEMRRLPRVVAETSIDKAVPVEVWRKGKAQTVQVKVGELEAAEEQGLLAAGPDEKQQPKDKAPAQKPTESLGMKLTAITPELRQQYEIKPDMKGVVITDVAGNSTAAEKGLRAGDVIIEVGQEEVRKPEDVTAKVQKAKEQSKKSVLLLVDRKGDLRFVAIPLS
ncbi:MULTISPECIES: DegQ family serine endoprotease [Azospirillum]|uniref:DegQ family serine endoprotease n=1 Tax=Azospirillum TaxID=191 RepID=UPI001FE86E37|nr:MULTISPECIES: DegQ family serine endoprotease [Azospirillum]MDW5535670.1 DegQ family serine endoprotease [Azospirillum sp. NL1]